jgi:hypothetical protein
MVKRRTIFESLYYGDIIPFERKVQRTKENIALHKKIENELRYFAEKMSLDDNKRFEEFQNLHAQSSGYEQEDAFAYGFKFATMLMSAVFSEE